MKLKSIRYLILLFIFGLFYFAFYLFLDKKKGNDKILTLQHLCLDNIDGTKTCLDQLDYSKPTLIIYFNPDCDHCQVEISNLVEKAEYLKDVSIVLICTELSLVKLNEFAQIYKIAHLPNLSLLIDHHSRFEKAFVIKIFPTTFLYSIEKKLITRIQGEYKISNLLDHLK